MPYPAVQVQPVAIGVAGGGVSDVGIQRVPLVGRLHGAIWPGDRAELAGETTSRIGRQPAPGGLAAGSATLSAMVRACAAPLP
jgi:hypothetical protein